MEELQCMIKETIKDVITSIDLPVIHALKMQLVRIQVQIHVEK